MTHYKNPFEDPDEKLWDQKIKDFKIPERKETPLEGKVAKIPGYIYVPKIKLYVAKEKSLHGWGWYNTHGELHKNGLQMLTIRQFIDFILYLKQNPDIQDAEKILDEILAKRKPYRLEWLDARFSEKAELPIRAGIGMAGSYIGFGLPPPDIDRSDEEELYIHYNHRTENGKLIAKNTELLEKCLMEDCEGDRCIDLKSCNKQGMPTKRGSDVEYYFPDPVEDCVAVFEAYHDGVGLNCAWSPLDARPGLLGVRAVQKVKINNTRAKARGVQK